MTINKSILKLAIPSILANITVPLVGMADIAIAGHLGAQAATLIGGIAIGSMLFDLLYWNFGFLRIGTGGLAAQAYGAGDRRECARVLARAMAMSLAIALFLIAIQWLVVKLAFLVVDCTPEVRELASRYFYIRIWAAPATLSLMALKGWFIGMQDSVSSMICDVTVNVANIGLSVLLALGLVVSGTTIVPAMGFSGIATGTLAAQWTGFAVAVIILAVKYFRPALSLLQKSDYTTLFKGDQTRRFFVMNTDLFVRSLCFIAIYIGFTVLSARYGDVLLAVSSILMKLLLLFSYFTDGFAYAGEALTGRFIGAKDPASLRLTVKLTFVWSMAVALIFVLIYRFAGTPMLRVMTSDVTVINAAKDFMPWLLLMPLVGCAAFTWDGIYIGATASRQMRNSMLWAAGVFAAVYVSGVLVLNLLSDRAAPEYASRALHILMAAYFSHLLVRTVYLTIMWRKKGTA